MSFQSRTQTGKRFNSSKNVLISYYPNVELLDVFRDENFRFHQLEHDYVLKVREYAVLLQIKTLSKRELQCLYKFYFVGMTQKAIGKEFKIKKSVVAIYLSRARKKIADYYHIDLKDQKNLRKQFLAIRNRQSNQ